MTTEGAELQCIIENEIATSIPARGSRIYGLSHKKSVGIIYFCIHLPQRGFSPCYTCIYIYYIGNLTILIFPRALCGGRTAARTFRFRCRPANSACKSVKVCTEHKTKKQKNI